MEKPRIKCIQKQWRVLASGSIGVVTGLVSWECQGRGQTGYGTGPDMAYRNWRSQMKEKKRHGIAMARHRKWEEKTIAEGRGYRKPNGMFVLRMNTPTQVKTVPVPEKHAEHRIPDAWWKFWKQEG